MLHYRIILAVTLTFCALASCSVPGRLFMLRDDGEFIEYGGSATLHGFYFLDPSNLETKDLVCFLPDGPSQKLLPQDSNVNSLHWMCFSNSASAKGLFGLDSTRDNDSSCYRGSAKITMRNYHRYVGESEGVSSSELTTVHQHDAASNIPCAHIWQSGI